jgi:hypothetical protein
MKSTFLVVLGCAWVLGCGGAKSKTEVGVVVSPTSAELDTGATQVFKADVSGTEDPAVIWSVEDGVIGGSISSDGLYTAPSGAGSFTVTATSVADPTKKRSVPVKVNAPREDVAIALTPDRLELRPLATRTFTAVVTGSQNTRVAWSILEGPVGGKVRSDGLYTAPEIPGTFHVVVTAAADPEKSAIAEVVVVQPPLLEVTVLPRQTRVTPNNVVTFTATVSNTENNGVQWSVEEEGESGTITEDGVYTAPAVEGTFHILAASTEDLTVIGRAEVTVSGTDPVTVAVSPLSATIDTGTTQKFTAVVFGNTNQGVIWSVLEATGGSISTSGLYTAPWVVGTYHVVATSKADTTKSTAVEVIVKQPPVVVTVSPASSVVGSGGTKAFASHVSGAQNTAVTWSIQEGAIAGSISATGVYTASTTLGTYHVVATSVADPAQSAVATVTVASSGPFSVSGTVSYVGVLTGRVYVYVEDMTGRKLAGTTLSAPGPFTIRGVKGLGSLRLSAFMDAIGTADFLETGDPSGLSLFQLAGADVTNVAVELEEPYVLGWLPDPPGLVEVTPAPGAAWVKWEKETWDEATNYRVYWSTTAKPNKANHLGSLEVTAKSDFAFVSGLTPGTTYFFSVSTLTAGSESTAKQGGSVVASALTGGVKLTGVVRMGNLTNPPAALYVFAKAGNGTTLFQRIENPVHPQAFSLPGAIGGKYSVWAVVDFAGDGKVDLTDVSNLDEPEIIVVPATGAAPVAEIKLRTSNCRALGPGEHVRDATGDHYFLQVDLLGQKKLPVSAVLTGTGLTSAWDLPANVNRYLATVDLGKTPPTAGTWTLSVAYSDGGAQTYTFTPLFLAGVATPTAPIGASVKIPTLTWTAPSPAPASYTQTVMVYRNATQMWASPEQASTVNSILYAGKALTTGLAYTWYVVVKDVDGNSSRQPVTITVQ